MNLNSFLTKAPRIDQMSRRAMLRAAGCGLGTLGLQSLMADVSDAANDPLAPKSPHFPARAKRVIFLFMHGGPSSIDTFDPKPYLDANDGKPLPIKQPLTFAAGKTGGLMKSPWQFKNCGQSGMPISSLLPNIRECADDLCVVRSMVGEGVDHGAALLQTFTGALKLEPPQLLKLTVLARILITLITSYISISILVQTRDDFRFIIPYVEFSKQMKGGRPLVLDTSVIIDGRIADLCDTRLVDTKIIVPRFVLQELQGIADSSDKLKRNRGRRGLDILKRLQSNTKVELLMHDGNAGESRGGEKIRVDERLVLFTKGVGGRVVTNDFNLNKIAQLQGVDVINLNEIANSLKTVALPGEYLQVKIVKAGDQIGQGVGYLDDGTMIVVENGRNAIGKETSILVTSVLQTPAGRMIFGRPESRPSGNYVPVGPPSSGFSPVSSSSPTLPSISAETGTHSPVRPNDRGSSGISSGPGSGPPKV